MTMDEKHSNGLSDCKAPIPTVTGVGTYGKQVSKIDLLKAQVSKDSLEAEGKWKPFKDVRSVEYFVKKEVVVCNQDQRYQA